MKNGYLIGLFVYQDAAEYLDLDDIAKFIFEQDVDDIFRVIERFKNEIPGISTINIPIFSSIHEVNNVLSILLETGVEYEDVEALGSILSDANKTEAQRKYGETHYRLASLLGLTTKTTPLRVTELGKQYYALKEDERKNVLAKLVLRVPIIQRFLIKAKDEYVTVDDELSAFLTNSSVARRRSSTKNLVKELMTLKSKVVRGRIDKLIW